MKEILFLLVAVVALLGGRGIYQSFGPGLPEPTEPSDGLQIKVTELLSEVAALRLAAERATNESRALKLRLNAQPSEPPHTPAPLAESSEPSPSNQAVELTRPVRPPSPAPPVALNGPSGRYAYVSMLANCKPNLKYRTYLSGILVFERQLRVLNSVADMVVLVQLAPGMESLPQEDLTRMEARNIKLKYCSGIWDRYLEADRNEIPDAQRAADKAVMYNKIFAWELVEYDLVQYVDADVMPIGDMDAYFARGRTTFINGWMSPLQGGWYLLKPDLKVLQDLVTLVKHRYSSAWDAKQSFDLYNEMPPKDRLSRPCLDDDQGLFYCYFKYSKRFTGKMDYVDHKNTYVKKVDSFQGGEYLGSVRGPKSFEFRFEHFGGRFKPWKVCMDQAMVERLPSIASQHAHHWPPTKLKSFRTYCQTFDEINAKALLQ